MEYLQKLWVIPQNIITTLKNMKQQTKQIEQFIVEPIILCYEAKIETTKIINLDSTTKRKKQTVSIETQTEPFQKKTKITITKGHSQVSQKDDSLDKKAALKSQKKQKKNLEKQIPPQEELSLTSDQTEPSQYSYCQNHFLTVLEQNEQQYLMEQNKLFSSAKKKTSKQYQKDLFKNYVYKMKEKYNEEKLILKSTRTQSSDDHQLSIEQGADERQQQSAIV